MPTNTRSIHASILIFTLLIIASSGCSTGQTQVLETTLAPEIRPSATLLPATNTPKPTLPATFTPTSNDTPTTAPSPTETVTLTPAPTFGPTGKGVSAWCLPENADLGPTTDPAHPPAAAKIAEWTGTALEVRNLPSNGCVFIYTFNQPAPADLTLQISDLSGGASFLSAALVPVPGDPNSVYAVLRHTWIITPPVWDVGFTFVVTAAGGAALRSDPVNLHRWSPQLCWNLRKPNPQTLRCPLPQDQHPWDPWYGTPMPTGLPEEE
jgi:hypothetical protein